MAARLVRRNSYDQFHETYDDDMESSYSCNCGQEYMTEEQLKRHQQNDCKSRSFVCSFCQEPSSSSAELREHLLLCGNKTDQCPNCHKLIRRSHFAYHYENNCAPVNEVETPPLLPKNRSRQNFPPNSNKPYLREDIPNDDYPSTYGVQVNGRIQSPTLNPRGSPGIVECEFCHNKCAKNDYQVHRNNCIRNPINVNQRPQPTRIPLKPNQSQNISNGIVHIPCEICNESIDIANWSRHTQNCREQETQRIENVARSKSQEPITEKFPCDYCQELFSAQQLHRHEANCLRNPEQMNSAAKLAQRQHRNIVSLPIKSKNNRNHPKTHNVRPPKNNHLALYESLDIDLTHAANRSNNMNQRPIRRLASDEDILLSNNPDHGYDNESEQSNEHRSYGNIAGSSRQIPSNGNSQHPGSSFENLREFKDNRDPINNVNGRRPQPRSHQGSVKVINNLPDRSYTKRNKVPWWKELFGCASKSRRNSS